MAYHGREMSSNYIPGGADDYWQPPAAPVLVAPNPQRIADPVQIQDGMKHMDLNTAHDMPHFSPFPKLHNKPSNVPQSDEELEATLENARTLVLNSNDPEMQLAWAQDALIYCGVSADHEERMAAAKPLSARSSTPKIEHQIKLDAMNIVTFLADQHHPKAEFLKGMWLEFGRFGQREDKKEAFRCFSRAADRGYARAEYRIGMMYESNNDPIKALRHYYKGVDAGDAASCYRMGMMTLRGQNGQPQDYVKGVQLIKASAEVADENAAQGAYVYGMLLSKELPQIDVPEQYLQFDQTLARSMLEKAAYLKFAKAQLKMGTAYELASLGCEFNPALSIHYMALAAKQGEPDAEMALSKWFLVGHEGLFQKNEDLAYTFAERAATSGLPTAEFAMGYFNEIGMKTPTNLDKALEWYHKAAEHGNEDAKGRIEGLRNKQVLSRKDHENVAISRIKSTYGSMRGQRPARLQQQASHMSSINETASSYSNGYGVQAPARGSSVTPYPEDDGPPNLGQRPQDIRANTVTPYPLDDGPPQHLTARPAPAGGFFAPQQDVPRPASTVAVVDPRPSSAFQINPDLRANSSSAVPQLRTSGQPYPQHLQAYPQQQRPATVNPADVRPPPAQRVFSGPPNLQQGQYAHPNLQPRPLQPQKSQSPAPPPAAAANVDIGFSANPEDRAGKRYYQAIQNPQVVKQQQQQYPPDHVRARLPQSSSMPRIDARSSLPSAASRPPEGRKPSWPSSSQGTPSPRPPPTPAKDSGAPLSAPPVAAAKPLPNKSAAPSKPAAAPPKSAPAKAAPPRLPGKGPSTFEEMGVPKTKDQQECAVM